MRKLKERIKRLALATAGINKSPVERIGLSPQLRPDWRRFFDKVLQFYKKTTLGRFSSILVGPSDRADCPTIRLPPNHPF